MYGSLKSICTVLYCCRDFSTLAVDSCTVEHVIYNKAVSINTHMLHKIVSINILLQSAKYMFGKKKYTSLCHCILHVHLLVGTIGLVMVQHNKIYDFYF